MPEKLVATKTAPRVVRVQNTDVHISECWYYPSKPDEMGRHWFDWADTIQTATYRQMCQKLGGRPKPRLPGVSEIVDLYLRWTYQKATKTRGVNTTSWVFNFANPRSCISK